MFECIRKKNADIKILHEGYTADYFLNRMKPIVSCVPQKTHSQQAMTKVKYVLVPDVK
jgi:hypothetical protein